MVAQLEQSTADNNSAVWYLGIDFGTTGISSVLLNYSTGQQYPIYWLNELELTPEELRSVNVQGATSSSGKAMFRLPTVTYSGPATKNFPTEQLNVQLSATPIVVGSIASKIANNQPGILLQNFKSYLKQGIPYYCPKRNEWEPTLQLYKQQRVSLYWVRRSLQALLETLMPKSSLPNSSIKLGAVGLEPETLTTVLQQLEGVILGCPIGWGDTYRFNLREAVLEAKLVRQAEQIFFLEEAIAPILAGLLSDHVNDPKRHSKGEQESSIAGDGEKSQSKSLHPKSPIDSPPHRWLGGTLVINAGATKTELALVDLPDDLQQLTYNDFSVCSVAYGGNGIDQDIFCQLLYPQLSEAQRQQLSFSDDLELPLPGQPDQPRRDRLTSVLHSSPLGEALLKASGYLKLILQHKDEFTLNLGTDQWTVTRQDLESRVLLPFLEQLNQQLNTLLIKTGISPQGVYQVLCIGGSAVLVTLKQWLQQKFSLATVIRDADLPLDTWVAAGLAALPMYPRVLNRFQQQYSDYFLLLELLRAFSETDLNQTERLYSLKEIMQRLERRGLNTSACYERLVRLVEGQLPLGLVPSIEEDSLLCEASKQNLQSLLLGASPQLFSKQDNQYCPNLQQQEALRQYLDMVLSGTEQKFEEPLIFKLDDTQEDS